MTWTTWKARASAFALAALTGVGGGLYAQQTLPPGERTARPDSSVRPDAGMHGMMRQMQDCPMMGAIAEGPQAALAAREELGLNEAQVRRLEALRVRNRQDQARMMAEMRTVHQELAKLTARETFDEAAARAAWSRMGALHADAGVAALRARHDTREVLTPDQREKMRTRAAGRAPDGAQRMRGMRGMHGMMRGMMGGMNGDSARSGSGGGMGMLGMQHCPMMMGGMMGGGIGDSSTNGRARQPEGGR